MEEEQEQLQELNNTDNLLLKYDLEKENFHFEEDKLQMKSNMKKNKQVKKDDEDVTFGENGIMIVREDPRRSRDPKIGNQNQKNGEEEQEPEARSFLNVKKKRKCNYSHIQ